MTVYINYINQQKKFLFENEGDEDLDDNSFMNFDLKISDIFNTDYIKKKLKELLFKTIPAFTKATKGILELIISIIIFYCQHIIIPKIKNAITNISDTIANIFNGISEYILKPVADTAGMFIMKIFYKEILELKESRENDFNAITDKINSFPSFEINFDEKDKIDQFCKLDEIQIFALETEDNYLCLPFNDEKKFTAIKVANYYDSNFDITDQESSDILDILIEHKEKGTNKFIRKIGNTPTFTYKIVENNSEGYNSWAGLFNGRDIKVREVFDANKKIKYTSMYSTFVHEFIHYKDDLLNHNKFTNNDLEDFIWFLGTKFKKNEIVPIGKFRKVIKDWIYIKDEKETKSVVRYIISVLQKQKYIDYFNNDFSKIKINLLPNYEMKEEKEGQYFNSPTELNTHLSNVIQASLQAYLKDFRDLEKNKEKIKDPFFIYKEMKIKNEEIKNSDFPDIAFTNEEYTKMYESFKKYKNNQKFVDSIKLFFNYMHFNKESTDFSVDVKKNKKETMKNYKKFVTSPFIKMMNLSSEELIEILKKVAKKNSSEVQTAFRDIILSSNKIFKEVYRNYCNYKNSTYNDSDLEFIIEDHVGKKINSIFDEILNRNEYKQNFKNADNQIKFRDELTKFYKKKVFEKLKNYQKNIDTNKEKFDKLE